MRIAKVVGKVTLSRCHPSLRHGSYRLVTPLSLNALADPAAAEGETLVVYDELGAGNGCRIAISEGREAAQPFGDEMKPVDVYNAAILDNIEVEVPKV